MKVILHRFRDLPTLHKAIFILTLPLWLPISLLVGLGWGVFFLLLLAADVGYALGALAVYVISGKEQD